MEKRKLLKDGTGQKVKEKIGMEGKRRMMENRKEIMKKERRNNISCVNNNDNSVNNIGSSNNIVSAEYKAGGKNTKCNSSI